MPTTAQRFLLLTALLLVMVSGGLASGRAVADESLQRLLYMAVPDPSSNSVPIKNEKGILVFDIANDFQCVRRIEMPQVKKGFRGLCADANTGRLFASHSDNTITCLDAVSGDVIWERTYETGCDRPDITPDGKYLYLPTGWWHRGKQSAWNVVNAANGDVVKTIPVGKGGAHNTAVGWDGRHAYLAAIGHEFLTVVDVATHEPVLKVGPLTGGIWPFTIDSKQQRAYLNVGEIIGFDIADLGTGELLHTVRVAGQEDVSRRVHGIGLTPDEKEVWITDSAAPQPMIYIFDNTVFPPKLKDTIQPARKSHGWVCFSRDGKIMFNDTGTMLDVATRKPITTLRTDREELIGSSKFVEVHLRGDRVEWTGEQIAEGRAFWPSEIR